MSSSALLCTTTPDGRMLSGRATGPESGTPVLFIAGAATGRSIVFGEELLDDLGVRLLTMDRPGMAASTPDLARTLASTADELAHPEIRAMLPAAATGLADLALQDPAAAAEVLGGFDAAAMERMVLEGSDPEDRSFYSAPEFLPRYRSALAEGFANDGAGYVRDTLIAMRPWNLPFDAIRVPVSVLFGARDRTHSPDLGEVLASRIPGARRTVFADAGGALLWTHAHAVLEAALGR